MNPKNRRLTRLALATFPVLLGLSSFVQAQDANSLNTFGMPGLIDMPTAESMEDADFVTSLAVTEDQTRVTLSFQITPRLTGAFRYSRVSDFGGSSGVLFDRSFDLQYRIVGEGRIRPAVAVGLRDFGGTGVFSSEYVVASKTVAPGLILSGGIGWGALGTYNSFDNPLGALSDAFDRRSGFEGLGGEPNTDNWFRGPAALFAGLRWKVDDKWVLSAEYSSDNQSRQLGGNKDGQASPLNIGLQYRMGPGTLLSAQFLHGDAVGLSAHFLLNPRNPPYGGDTSPAPMPFLMRGEMNATWAGAITQDTIPESRRIEVLRTLLAHEGILLEAIAVQQNSVRVRIRNTRFNAEPQALGRTARALALGMPARIEVFEIEIMSNGVPLSRVSLQRSTLERLDDAPDAISRSLAATVFNSGDNELALETLMFDRFNWRVGPYLGLSLFDPDDPLRADLGIEAEARYDFTSAWSLTGAVRGKLLGNRGDATRQSDSVLPRVRSNQNLYDQASDVWLQRLTIDHFGKMSDNLYTRVSAGYLEDMFAGVSGEVLWKPVESRFALGAELNHVFQRDNDRLFGFDDYDYEVTTGHVSAYYAMQNGFDLQLDMGRYLAGDWGVTVGIDRRFGNGWSIGAFATLTDVPFYAFGEGSFDKGIRFTVPLSWLLGAPTQTSSDLNLRLIQRDGGARLNVSNRLYSTVRDTHAPELRDQWGRFWR
jgi:hypothetical protein